MKIYFTIVSLIFPYTIKILLLFFSKYKLSPIKSKKMRERRGERKIYIKRKLLLCGYATKGVFCSIHSCGDTSPSSF
jgi:hypothetical protein